MERLRTLPSVFPPDLKDTKPSVASLKRLHYTENALKEALRKYAIVPVVTRQAVKDDKLGDFSIPKDTKVVVPIIAVHHNSELWPEPLKFKPERFDDDYVKHAWLG